MQISKLLLRDFRNHKNLNLSFLPGATTIVGPNGRGKTNIVEAVHYLATLSSHRVSQDGPLIRTGLTTAQVDATVIKHDRQAQVELTINYPGVNKVSLNGAALPKPKDLLGLVSTVIFSPEDLDLIKGEPGARRRFIDDFSTLLTPKFMNTRSEYERTLKQRNTLLKSLGRKKPTDSAKATLAAWDEQLVTHGSELIATRLRNLNKLQPHISNFGNTISGNSEPLVVNYASTWLPKETDLVTDIENEFRTQLEKRFKDEVERGVTLVGPHRDDLDILLSDMPAKGYASHGQSWSIAIALRLATFTVLREHDDDPILILDDVFAELDEKRRTRLIEAITGVEQTLITAAVQEDIPKELLSNQLVLDDN
jgi:DNA replication and repair protein RecF